MKPLILIVEDEPTIAENLIYALGREGFLTHWADTVFKARDCLLQNRPQLVILDVGLPDENGFDFCREITARFFAPVLFLTARTDEIDRVVGLEIGAEDYVVKPFSVRELVARVKVILRRRVDEKNSVFQLHPPSTKDAPTTGNVLFRIDEDRYKVFYRDAPLELSPTEYRLLKTLLKRPGRIFTRDELMQQAWESPESSLDRTVDAHIKNIRQELKRVGSNEEIIATHRGLGYSLKEE